MKGHHVWNVLAIVGTMAILAAVSDNLASPWKERAQDVLYLLLLALTGYGLGASLWLRRSASIRERDASLFSRTLRFA